MQISQNFHSAFRDREEAGKLLANKLIKYYDSNAIILALPRGGVVVGYELVKKLHLPLEVMVARKLGAPHNPELGIGAIAEGGIVVKDEKIMEWLNLTKSELDSIITSEKKELERRVTLYREGRPFPSVEKKIVILVDDGLATGVTAQAAIRSIMQHHPYKLVFAVPVCDFATAKALNTQVDSLTCMASVDSLGAISMYYQDFKQVTDNQVLTILHNVRDSTLIDGN